MTGGGLTRAGRWPTVARVALVAAAITGCWLLLAGSFDVVEVAAAVLVGLAAALAGARLRRYVGHRQAGARLWIRHLPRMLVGAYRDCWRLTVLLVRRATGSPIHGRFRLVDYEPGDDAPEQVGRRVLTVFGTTLQPGSYVVAFDDERRCVLVHVLEPSRREPIPPALRGGP